MEDYSKRELDMIHQRVDEKFTEMRSYMDDKFEVMFGKQDYTNGNVEENRERIQKLEQWRWWLMGSIGVVVFITVFIAERVI